MTSKKARRVRHIVNRDARLWSRHCGDRALEWRAWLWTQVRSHLRQAAPT